MPSMVFPLKNNEKIATLWTKKEEKQKARIDFEDIRVIKEDGGLVLGFWAIACDAYSKEDKVKYPGILEARLNYDDPGDKALGYFLEKLNPEKGYSGYVEIDAASKFAVKINTAISDGNESLIEMFKDSFISVTEVEKKKELDEWKPSEKKSGGKGYNSKSKLEIAKERLAAMEYLISDETAHKKLNESLTLLYGSEPTTEIVAHAIYQLISYSHPV